MLTDGLESYGLLWGFFISHLDSHADGTHSLQKIHWWASDAMLHFSKSVPMKNNSSTSWMARVYVNFGVKCPFNRILIGAYFDIYISYLFEIVHHMTCQCQPPTHKHLKRMRDSFRDPREEADEESARQNVTSPVALVGKARAALPCAESGQRANIPHGKTVHLSPLAVASLLLKVIFAVWKWIGRSFRLALFLSHVFFVDT